jgi:hypothetical protein
MIVRILSEGQFRISGAQLDHVNEIDNAIVEAVEKGDEANFRRLLAEMIDYVHKNGQELPVEELVESDVILPYPDISLQEAKEMFIGEGLIPG